MTLVDRIRASFSSIGERLSVQVDGASLALFRMAYGCILAWELVRFFQLDRIQRYYLTPELLFPYYGFGWLRPLSEPAMQGLFVVLIGLALLIAVGLFYQWATLLFFVGYTYTFLLDQANYQNHLYLNCLLALLLSVVRADRVWSVDAWRTRSPRSTVPLWHVGIVAGQVGVVYAFGGLNKLNSDWLTGVPMGIELAPLARRFELDFLLQPLAGKLFAYAGIAIDLLAVPLLCWRRTRPYMFLVLLGFHLTNSQLFSIGVFPWFMIAATTIFFPCDWPRRLLRRGTKASLEAAPPASTAGLQWWLLGAYVAMQLLLPLRQHLYPGNPAWTHDAQYFSWTMKLNVRDGVIRLFGKDDQGKVEEVNLLRFLSPKQIDHMAYKPDMVVRFSKFAVSRLPKNKKYELTWFSTLSLNGRQPQKYVMADAHAVAKEEVSWRPTKIVAPLSLPAAVPPQPLARADGP